MSTRCIDPDLGNLLHPYELGLLEGEERDRLEEHLIACRHCAEELRAFADPAHALVASAELRTLVDRSVQERAALTERLRRALWPDAPVLLRPAVAYVAVALLLYPAYRGLQTRAPDRPVPARTILLAGTRSLLSIPRWGDEALVLYFRVTDHREGSTYAVSLVRDDSTLVYGQDRFGAVNDREMGTIVLPRATLAPGAYILYVNASDGTQVEQYAFQLK